MASECKTNVTFRFDGTADQVYLCVKGCGEGPKEWRTLALSETAPRVWTTALALEPGWWRFRYYTEHHGCLFYTEPTYTDLQIDGWDTMLHVSRDGRTPRQRVHSDADPHHFTPDEGAKTSDQFMCVLPKQGDGGRGGGGGRITDWLGDENVLDEGQAEGFWRAPQRWDQAEVHQPTYCPTF